MKTFICSRCGKTKPVLTNGGTGYAEDDNGALTCYMCCAIADTEYMLSNNRIDLYLSEGKISNWPGTLKIIPSYQRKGKHNIAGTRTDVWFTHAGRRWHGVQYGEWNQILRCKALKGENGMNSTE